MKEGAIRLGKTLRTAEKELEKMQKQKQEQEEMVAKLESDAQAVEVRLGMALKAFKACRTPPAVAAHTGSRPGQEPSGGTGATLK